MPESERRREVACVPPKWNENYHAIRRAFRKNCSAGHQGCVSTMQFDGHSGRIVVPVTRGVLVPCNTTGIQEEL